MGKEFGAVSAALLCMVCGPAAATTFAVQIVDQDGKAAPNAVVTLTPEGRSMPAPGTRSDAEKVIDQRNETFIPLVTVLPRNGHIVFANHDKTKHQVYSFSAIKQFEITLVQGENSPPFLFDKAGIATVGCNIHDHMIAYVVVTDSPWTAVAGADGRAEIADVPAGNYDVQVWHPQLPPGSNPPTDRIVLSGDTTAYTAKLKLLSPPPMGHMHMAHY
ncbi:MAG TPA: hypothetical protein VFW28_20260 [Micropepsaceae bacterium]|nr:hypothetical protein [Micropepsaceae bacterium]